MDSVVNFFVVVSIKDLALKPTNLKTLFQCDIIVFLCVELLFNFD